MVKKWICIIGVLITLSGCAGMMPRSGDSRENLIANSRKAVATLTWIKGVTDTVFTLGCSGGQFSAELCSNYETLSGMAKSSLDVTKAALTNYEETGSPLNEELLLTAFKGLAPYVLKFDAVYKNPTEASL